MLRTAQFVTPMHPDKICDRIADSILDECLKQDKNSRVAIQVMGGHRMITVTGQLTTKANIDIQQIVRKVYPQEQSSEIIINVVQQSPEIGSGVDNGGAGDQGIMIGYACNENKQMLPQQYYLARSLCKYIFGFYPYDGKTQITIDENNNIINIIASFQNVKSDDLLDCVRTWVCNTIEKYNENPQLAFDLDIKCNPAGDWSIGGFSADTGVTGRKIVIDSYGPRVPVGGGSFSGKDPTKVDRSAAYMARYIAVELLKKKICKNDILVRLAYAIGYNQPLEVSVIVDGKYDYNMSNWVKEIYDLSPNGIIQFLRLKHIENYEQISSWGHFGNNNKWG